MLCYFLLYVVLIPNQSDVIYDRLSGKSLLDASIIYQFSACFGNYPYRESMIYKKATKQKLNLSFFGKVGHVWIHKNLAHRNLFCLLKMLVVYIYIYLVDNKYDQISGTIFFF